MADTASPGRPSAGLVALVEANAPLWAGEAEVFRTYWDWAGRSLATDLQWLARQCYKELFDGFIPRLEQLHERFRHLDAGVPRRVVLESAEDAYEELAHYCAFADAHDAVGGDDGSLGEPLTVDRLRTNANWAENRELGELRARHRRDHGELGLRAQAFTEGGCCTLYSEGMRLAGRGGSDDLIAGACKVVYDDEWDHMLEGVSGLAHHGLNDDEWGVLTELTVAQMKLRITMRNAQFAYPLPDDRVRQLQAGAAKPLPFDYARAGF